MPWMSKYYLILIICFLLSESCQTDQTSPREHAATISTNYTAKVTSSAGEYLDDFSKPVVPTFFNVGILESDPQYKTIILGQRYREGKKVKVMPVAQLQFNRDTLPSRYLVSLPEGTEKELIADDYVTFMSKDSELVSAIENWFKTQCGFAGCSDFQWSSPHKTLLLLDSKKLKG